MSCSHYGIQLPQTRLASKIDLGNLITFLAAYQISLLLESGSFRVGREGIEGELRKLSG